MSKMNTPTKETKRTYNFVDMLGQPLQVGDKFAEVGLDSYDVPISTRYGVIKEITASYYTLLFTEGPGSKRGSVRTANRKILINYETIIQNNPVYFL